MADAAIDVSVVVPTRDRSRILETTLRSVQRQRNVRIEVIVVDDASSDQTPEVLASVHDARFRMLRNPIPAGPGEARNRGASEARGEWLAFLDDDDLWAPTKLARQIETATDVGSEWVYAGSVNVDDRLRVIHGRPPPEPGIVMATLPRSNAIPGGGSNVVVRRRAFAEVGGFDERFSPCEDWELWIRLMRFGPPAAVRAPLMGYRVHPGGRSRDLSAVVRAARRIELEHRTDVDWGRLHRWFAESQLRSDRHLNALGQFARAAVRGQARGVASDLALIVRRRITRVLGRQLDARPVTGWAAEASVWLRELERSKTRASERRSGS